jgi:hypothetical protein
MAASDMNPEGRQSDPDEFSRLRDRPAQVWRLLRLPVFILLIVAVVVLGVTGFATYAKVTGSHWSFPELLYRTLMLFAIQGGEVEDSAQMNLALEAARFLAPALTVYAALLTIVSLFSEQWARLKIRLWFRQHIVICGLGGIGYRLACRCRAAGWRVVVIERDTGNDRIVPCRNRGISVLIGDTRDPFMLTRAGVTRARHVVVICGDDGTNVEVGMALRRAVPAGRRDTVSCILHLLDANTCELLGERELRHPEKEPVRLHFFNVYQRAVQALLRAYPLFEPDKAKEQAPTSPNLLIVGLGRMGQSFVGEVARLWHRRHEGRPPCRLPITVLDRDASALLGALRARQPFLDQLCDFAIVDLDLASANGQRGDFLRPAPEDPKRPAFTHIYVFFSEDARSLSAALQLQRQLRVRFGEPGEAVRITVRTLYHTGLGELLLEEQGALALLQPFAFFESVCDPSLLPETATEMLARAFHRDFLLSEAKERRQDPRRPRKPTDRPWEKLDEDTRRANRARADAIEKQLSDFGLRLRPRLDWNAPYFEFTSAEIEELAKHEHARWCEERRSQGWRHGAPRDDARKIHPDLVDWPDLRESSKEFNRYSCRRIPLLLADFDFEILREENG